MWRRLCSTATCWRRLISAASVMKRKEPTAPVRARSSAGRGRGLVEGDLGHLAELFGEGHFGDELVGEGAGFGIGGRGGDGLGDLVRGDGGCWS